MTEKAFLVISAPRKRIADPMGVFPPFPLCSLDSGSPRGLPGGGKKCPHQARPCWSLRSPRTGSPGLPGAAQRGVPPQQPAGCALRARAEHPARHSWHRQGPLLTHRQQAFPAEAAPPLEMHRHSSWTSTAAPRSKGRGVYGTGRGAGPEGLSDRQVDDSVFTLTEALVILTAFS